MHLITTKYPTEHTHSNFHPLVFEKYRDNGLNLISRFITSTVNSSLRHSPSQEAYEQKHLEEVNRVMEENSRERQRLLREIEVLQNTPKHHPHLTTATLNTSTSPGSGGGRGGGPGRISISSDQSDLFLLDTEFEYLKDILLKYLKGEHTEQLLKVIIAILRYSDEEKVQILKTLTGRK